MVAKKRRYKKGAKQEKVLMGLLMLLNILIVAFLVFGNLKLYAENRAIGIQYFNLDEELGQLERRNQELREMFFLAYQDDQIEKFLRERGLYKREGEGVVAITRNNIPENLLEGEMLIKTASVWDKMAEFFRQLFGQ